MGVHFDALAEFLGGVENAGPLAEQGTGPDIAGSGSASQNRIFRLPDFYDARSRPTVGNDSCNDILPSLAFSSTTLTTVSK